MKKIYLILLFFSSVFLGLAQERKIDTIEIAVMKNVQIVFPDHVESVDFGSSVFGFKKEDKSLLVFAKQEGFMTTNMNVKTNDGYVRNYYVFMLSYNEYPSNIFHVVSKDKSMYAETLKEKTDTKENSNNNSKEAESHKEYVVNSKIAMDLRGNENIGIAEDQIYFYVDGIYAKGDYLYLRVNIDNTSNIRYDIDFIRFVSRGKGKRNLKKRVSDEKQHDILFETDEEEKSVLNGDKMTKVFAFEKFTIDKKERLFIEFWEVNGKRQLEIEINDNELLGAMTF